MVIADESNQSLKLNVTGININDLSDPRQGVCKIKLKFTHQYIGDLSIILVSPIGQKVELIGPVCPTSITQNSLFDISFVKCLVAPLPDPGFKFRWDNCQKWGAFSKRIGSYWPYKNCLEDFNTGPVNGTWTLIIKDEDRFYNGKLLSFCIEFCDNEFENCENCEANGGIFERDTFLSFCRNDPGLNLSNLPVIPTALKNNPNYSYKYYIASNDKIIELKNSPDLTGKMPGQFTICGVSYLVNDEANLPTIASLDKFSKIRTDFASGSYGICAAMSVNCLHVVINDFSPITNLNIKICSKDTFVVGDEKYTRNGNYTKSLKNRFGCDSTVKLNLVVEDLNVNIASVLAIDCVNNNIVIDATASSVPSDALIEWISNDGNIIDSTNKLKIIVNKKGKYKLRISNKKCIDSAEVEVFGLEDIPELKVVSDTISCKKPNISLMAITNTANVMWQWRDINNFLIGDKNIQTITKADRYTVIVTDQNGCSNIVTVNVLEDKVVPNFNLTSTEISCKVDSAHLVALPNGIIDSYDWKKNNLTISNDSTVFVKDTGKYLLTLTGFNGCSLSKEVEVLSRKEIPLFRALFNEINCRDSSISIISYVKEPFTMLEFYKNEPDSFYFSGKDPLISKAGKYYIRLIDTANCILDTFIEVSENFTYPVIKLTAKNLSCSDDSVQLRLQLLSDTSLAYNYFWTGPIGFGSIEKEPWIKEGGFYYVNIVGPNGCKGIDSIKIEEDLTRPRIELFADTLTCKTLLANVQSKVSNAIKYEWSGPDPNLIASNSDIIVSVEGFYKLIVTASNGCTSERTIEVIKDLEVPFTNVKDDTINCRKRNINLQADFNSKIDSVNWFFNGIYFANDMTPSIDKPGIYTLYARGLNGCDNRDSINVSIDTNRVFVEILSDTLTCLLDSVELSPDPIILGAQYRWILPTNDTLYNSIINSKIKGNHYLQVTESNGCITELMTEVIERKSPPILQFLVDTITCKRKIASISSVVNNSKIKYIWRKPDQSTTDSALISTDSPGKFYVTITDEFGCVGYDSVEVVSRNRILQLTLSDSIFSCSNKDSNFITFNSVDSIVNFYWTDPFGSVLKNNRIDNVSSGLWLIFAENSDGCEFNSSLNVRYDTNSPIILEFSIDTLSCKNRILNSDIKLSGINPKVKWSNTTGFISNLFSPVFPSPGAYTLEVVDSNGCRIDTIINIVVDTILPSISLQSDTITCINTTGTISVLTNDPSNVIVLINSKSDTLRSNPLKTQVSDIYKVVALNNKNGCKAIDSIQLLSFRSTPIVSLGKFSFACKDDSLQLNAMVDCQNADYTWINQKTLISSKDISPFIKDTGLYELKVICPNSGCDTMITFRVDRQNSALSLNIISDTLNCYKDSIQVIVTTSLSDSIFEWHGPNQFYSQNRNPIIKLPGIYTLKISNSSGCSKDTIVEIVIDSLKPTINLVQQDTLRCDSNMARIILFDSDPLRNKIFKWSSSDGNIVSDSSYFITINKPGTYNVQTTDAMNGCQANQEIQIIKFDNKLFLNQIEITEMTCFDKNDGEIVVRSVLGGTKDYKYRINNEKYDTNHIFSNLSSGQYTIEVVDRYGCKADTLLFLQQPKVFQLEIIKDTVLNLGETVELNFVANFSNIEKIIWDPTNTLSCNDCKNPIASPSSTQEYKLTLIDSNGCEISDKVLVTVISDVYVFVPSIFSPNGDGINDYLEVVATAGINLIESYRVFDRWGAIIYERKNFDPSIKTYGWNGEHNGQRLNPGVYVYDIVALLKSGKKLRLAGDVTLLR